jgi:hypothetical protein
MLYLLYSALAKVIEVRFLMGILLPVEQLSGLFHALFAQLRRALRVLRGRFFLTLKLNLLAEITYKVPKETATFATYK